MGNSKLKPAGWWSRRHKTREAQDAARERYKAEHGRKARQRKAKERHPGALLLILLACFLVAAWVEVPL